MQRSTPSIQYKCIKSAVTRVRQQLRRYCTGAELTISGFEQRHGDAGQWKGQSSDRGFVLISALLLGLVLGSILLGLQLAVRHFSTTEAEHQDSVELDASLGAALNRMIFAYLTPNDPLRSSLVPDGTRVPWHFAGKTLTLSVFAESGKWDLNAGDRRHIAMLLSRLFPDQTDYAMNVIDAARSARRTINSVSSALTPWDRMTEMRERFARHFTVATDQNGIDPMTADQDTLLSMPSLTQEQVDSIISKRGSRETFENLLASRSNQLFVTERPVYTFRAETTGGFRQFGAMEAIVSFSERGTYSVFSWERVGMLPATSATQDP